MHFVKNLNFPSLLLHFSHCKNDCSSHARFPFQKTSPTNFSAPINKKSQNVRHSQLRLFDFQKNRNTSKKIIKKIETL